MPNSRSISASFCLCAFGVFLLGLACETPNKAPTDSGLPDTGRDANADAPVGTPDAPGGEPDGAEPASADGPADVPMSTPNPDAPHVVECTPNAKRCGQNQTPDTCDAQGDWIPGTKCQFVCTGLGECTGECLPGALRCGGTNKLTIETCDATGKYVAGTVCPNLCANGSCGGSCKPDMKRCGPNNVPESCSPEGTWTPGTACPFVCQGDGVCGGVCAPGSKRCSGNTLETCDGAGAWAETQKCNSSAGCNQARKACNTCPPGNVSCDGTTVKTCNANGTGTSSDSCGGRGCNTGDDECCPSGTKWDGGICRRQCTSDDQCGTCEKCMSGACRVQAGDRCEGGLTLITCSSAGKETRKTCPSGQCTGNACTACGGNDQPCCTGSKCNNGDLVCDSRNGKCFACGEPGQLCCAGDVCKDSAQHGRHKCGTTNGARYCNYPCATEGEYCCDRGEKCNPGLICDQNPSDPHDNMCRQP